MAQPSPYLADRIRPNSFGDAAAGMNNPGVTQPRSTFGSMAAQAATPATAQAPGAAAELPEWSRGQSSYGDQMRSVGQALMNVPKHIVSAPGYGLNSDMQRPGETSEAFAQRRTGPSPQDAPAPAAPGTPAAPNPTDQRLAAGTQAAPMGLAAAALASPPPASSPATPDNQVMPGVFNHGRGQYSDQAGGMGMPATFTGQPSAQNMAAADTLAARALAESMGRVAASQQPAAPPPSLIMSGNTGFRRDSRFLAQELGAQRALDRAQGRDPASLARAAGLQRTAMEQQGANQRSLWQYALEQQRINQQGEAQGYTNRAAAQQEQLRSQLVSEQDPARRQTIAQRLRELQGQAEPPAFKSHVIPNTRNVDGSTTMGGVYQENTRTGEGRWVPQPGQGSGVSPIGENQQAIAIRDNPNLSREQKVEALRKLGYS